MVWVIYIIRYYIMGINRESRDPKIWNLAEQISTCGEPEGDSRNIMKYDYYRWILILPNKF